MADLIPFRVHFQANDAVPFDTMATGAADAREQAEAARPGELIRKIKVMREKVE